ncbi:MAG TPA: NlpC/P60 family protein [Nocardioidaceae bacterium]|nr:NlpC/P60 family protein [Nocardioidaceae bacterium]
MFEGRKRTSTVIAALGVATLGGAMLSTPSYAEPDIDDVQVRVDRLYHEAEQASERYNVVRVDLEKNRSRLESLRADLARQQDKVDEVRDQVAVSVVAQSQGQGLSSTSQVLLSENPDEFLSQLSTVSAYNDQQSQMMADFAAKAAELETREESAQRTVAEIAEAEDNLSEEKAAIDAKAGEAKDLLNELEAEERARFEAAQAPSRSGERAPVAAPASAPASGSAGAAVEFAMAQVGDAYVYGAAGPDAWDCSGLTMAAWGAAGVSLPHSSSGQMGSGTPVSQSELQPGDLVFYYSPVSHVGMYIGNGQLVHAANPSSPVEVVPANSMPFSGAVRPGG